jgi:hypothetical protein
MCSAKDSEQREIKRIWKVEEAQPMVSGALNQRKGKILRGY